MTSRLQKQVYYGRPYGGVGFLWANALCSRINIGAKAVSGRCVSIELELDSCVKISLIIFYFPCYSSSVTYSVDTAECMSFIEEVIGNGQPAVIF